MGLYYKFELQNRVWLSLSDAVYICQRWKLHMTPRIWKFYAKNHKVGTLVSKETKYSWDDVTKYIILHRKDLVTSRELADFLGVTFEQICCWAKKYDMPRISYHRTSYFDVNLAVKWCKDNNLEIHIQQ